MVRTRGSRTTATSAGGAAARTSASAPASPAAPVPQCDWERTAFTTRDEGKLRRAGVVPDVDGNIIIPGNESRPSPPAGYAVMFMAFLFRGLSLPAHEFLRGILFTYGVQIWQLAPNSILQLAIFITLCEGFLGIEPHFGLWKKIFWLKRHSNAADPYVLGGVGFSVRQDVKYFKFPLKESVQDWRSKWFYIKDEATDDHPVNFPPFEDVMIAKPKKTWANTIPAEEEEVVEALYQRVQKIRLVRNPTSIATEIVAHFLKRRI